MGERMRYLLVLLMLIGSTACAAEPPKAVTVPQDKPAPPAEAPAPAAPVTQAPANQTFTITLTAQEVNDLGTNLVMAMRACSTLADQAVPICEQRALISMAKLQEAVNAAQKK
jgi:hypothetical protein